MIELLVTVVMVAILSSVAVPSFWESIRKSRVQAEQRDLKFDLGFARSEAVSENLLIGICGSDNATDCKGSQDWSEGWIIFADDGSGAGATPGDGVLDGDEAILRVYEYRGENQLVVTDASGDGVEGLSFSSRGYLDAVQRGSGNTDPERLTMRICDSEASQRLARALVIDIPGRVINSFDNNNNGIFEDENGDDLVCP